MIMARLFSASGAGVRRHQPAEVRTIERSCRRIQCVPGSIAAARGRRLMIWIAAEKAGNLPGAPVLEIAQLLAPNRQDRVDWHITHLSGSGEHFGKGCEHR